MYSKRTVLLSLSLFCFLAASTLRAHDDRTLYGAIYPQISRDGSSVVFAYQGAIWRLDRMAGRMTRLSNKAGYDTWPTWSPDGQRIAYINGRGSHIGPIKIIDAGGGKVIPTKRKQNPIAKHKLAFSPDGKRIFGLFNKEGRYALRWFDLDKELLSDGIYPDTRSLRYALSHDGKSVALATSLDVSGEQGGNNGPQCDLWIMSSQSEEAKPSKLMQFPGRVYDVTWSHNSKSLIVVSNVGGAHNDLWEVPIDNPRKGMRKLTFGQADEDTPSTDSSGRWLVYSDNRRGPTMLVARDLKSTRELELTVLERDFGRKTGMLQLSTTDAGSGSPITTRVSIQDEFGKYHAPKNALYRMLRRDIHFYCEGTAAVELPVGKYNVKVARGPEYRITRMQIVVKSDEPQELKLEVKRWTNQRLKKWFSGESHIHANYGYGEWYNSPRTMLAQSAGEDLIVNNFMVANSEADGVFDRQYFRGYPDPLSTDDTILYWNQEFRSTIWGHMTLLNLKQLVEPIFTGFARTTNPHDHPTNSDIADHTHDQYGYVNYTHPAQNVRDPYLSAYSAKALPLDVALGKIDSMDIMGSNHRANMQVWYRLLNCGFHVPAAAGTDCFLNRIRSRLPGQVRVYVKVDEPFSYQNWIDSLRRGRTFVTDGPMLEFQVNQKEAGSSIQLLQQGKVRVVCNVTSQFPLEKLEIVRNGVVVHTARAAGEKLEIAADVKLEVDQTGWIAVRALGPAHPDQPTNTVFAHSSPVYLNVKGAPLNSTEPAKYFIAWIDRLRADIRKRNRIPSRHQVHVENQISKAREVFNRLLK